MSVDDATLPFRMACPDCRGSLSARARALLACSRDGREYPRREGVWRLLAPDRADLFRRFVAEYTTVRRAERRGAEDPEYYRALPFRDRTGRHEAAWRIRAKSYECLLERVVKPLERERGRPLKALDLGAGNGWLSYRLARRGHRAAAVDLQTDRRDGLGAHVHYDARFTPVQAEFDRLPFEDDEVDLIAFNSALHYATDYRTTLEEAIRTLKADGLLVVMDSPIYRDPGSGERMVEEREARFLRDYGFASDALPSENYLTRERIAELAADLEIRWRSHTPAYGWRWTLRPLRARVRGRREPARFELLVGRRDAR